MKPWLSAARPKTLPAAVAPVAAGTALGARLAGDMRWDLAWLALASCLCLQIATNLFNDAIDFKKGADTADRMGPVRATAAGLLSSRRVLAAAAGLLLLAGVLALPLLAARGWVILAFGLPSLYFCYGYTGGPFPLSYRGCGDLFVLLFFGWVAVVGSCFLQTGAFDWPALLLGTQIGFLSTALIAINNLRDIEEDRKTGKQTLAVRAGLRVGRVEIAVCLIGPHALGILWNWTPFPELALWPLLSLPLAALVTVKVFRTPPSGAYNIFLGMSALHLLLFAALAVLALAASFGGFSI